MFVTFSLLEAVVLLILPLGFLVLSFETLINNNRNIFIGGDSQMSSYEKKFIHFNIPGSIRTYNIVESGVFDGETKQ